MSSIDGSIFSGQSPSLIDPIVVTENEMQSTQLGEFVDESLFMNLNA